MLASTITGSSPDAIQNLASEFTIAIESSCPQIAACVKTVSCCPDAVTTSSQGVVIVSVEQTPCAPAVAQVVTQPSPSCDSGVSLL
jgi:hypothetical protein